LADKLPEKIALTSRKKAKCQEANGIPKEESKEKNSAKEGMIHPLQRTANGNFESILKEFQKNSALLAE
jgi:hypothetical protein